MKASELLKRIESKSALLFVDARSDIEFRKGHIPGAVNAQFWKILLKRVQLPQDKNVEMVIACGHGPRAKAAKWLLGLYGYRNTALLEGHMSEWIEAGLPLEK